MNKEQNKKKDIFSAKGLQFFLSWILSYTQKYNLF